MVRSEINKDVVTLLDRYPVDEIMDKIIEYAGEDNIKRLKKWCNENMGITTDEVGDNLDKTILRGIQTDLDNLNARVGRIERKISMLDVIH